MMLSWFFAAASLLAALCYWLHWRWTHRAMLKLDTLIPGPPALPILGNALIFMAKPTEILKHFELMINKYGKYVRFWLGPDFNVIVEDPDDIRLLLTSNKVNSKGPVYEYLKPIIGEGILSGGPSWRVHRKIANHSYSKKSVLLFTDTFNKEAVALTKVLMSKNPTKTFNIFYDVLDSTTQSVCQTLMGLSKEESQNVHRLRELMLQTQNIYDLLFQKMTKWWYQIPLIYWLLGQQKRHNDYKKLVDDVMGDITSKRRTALAAIGVTSLDDVDNDGMGIVDRYILCGLDEQEVKKASMALFTTSQEAGAKIASAVFLFLAHLPEWQDKVFTEIVEVLGPHDRPITEEEVKKLSYLDMVYKEVLRYLSIAAMVQRTVKEEIAIDGGKIVLPPGTSLAIPIHVLHRDARYWPEPNKVDPGRFLPENVKSRNPNAFVPFSLGPMDCLGRVFATAMIKIMVVHAMRHVVFEADGRLEDLDIHVAISVRFADGYNVRCRSRSLPNGRTGSA